MAVKQQNWNELDEAAEREGLALKKAFRSGKPRGSSGKRIGSYQAIWDESLEIYFTQCRYCGRTLKEGDNPNADDSLESSHAQMQDIDVCEGCRFLHGIVERKTAPRKQD